MTLSDKQWRGMLLLFIFIGFALGSFFINAERDTVERVAEIESLEAKK